MGSLAPIKHRPAFVLHAAGAMLFFALVLLLVLQIVYTPVDLFVQHGSVFLDILRFAVLGSVFYGYSLTLLRLCNLSAGWGAAYAASSWLLFTLACFPASHGSGGMMRRIADPEGYEAARRAFEQGLQLFKVAVVVGFGLVQAVFLRYALRRLRAGAGPLRWPVWLPIPRTEVSGGVQLRLLLPSLFRAVAQVTPVN